ncbi:MAG: NAD(P)H-binding protein [Bacteroidota bacterium]
MIITIIGATGVLGRNLLPHLLERGHQVRAIVRKKEQVVSLEHLGIRSFIGDILDAGTLLQPLKGSDCVIHSATAIPSNVAGGDWTMNDRIRREGTRNLLECAQRMNVRRYIQQSITMLYGDYGAQIVDESFPLQPSPYIQSALDMEESVKKSGLDWCILRGGYFYGPSTGLERSWRDAGKAGTLRIPANSNALVSLIHAADMARAIVAASEHASAQSIYNVVDDHPVTYRELLTYIAHLEGGPEPTSDGTNIPSLGCSNRLIKTELDWEPLYPSYRSGLS